jgi:hypothetical protein
LAELDEELAHSDAHIDNLEARLHIFEQEKADLQIQVKDLTDIVDAASLASQLASKERAVLVEQYSKQIEELESKLKQTQTEKETQAQDSDSMNQLLKEENEKLREEKVTSLSAITFLENQNFQLTEEKQRMEELLEESHMEAEELESQLTELRESYDLMKNSEIEIQHLLETAQERVLQAELRTKEAEEAYQTATQEIQELGDQIERIKWRSKEEIDEWSSKISQLEQELELTRKESLATKATLLQEHQLQSQSSLEQSETESNLLKELLTKAELKNQSLFLDLEAKQNENLLLQKEIAEQMTLKDQLKEMIEELTTLQETTLPSLQQELQDQILESSSLKETIQTLESDLMNEKQKQEQLHERNSHLEEELSTLTERNLELESIVTVPVSSSPPPSPSPQSKPTVEDTLVSLTQLNQSLDRAFQDLREERERSDNYRTKKDAEVLEVHRQMIVLQEKLQTIQNHNREMADTLELERKNRTAILNDSKQELQETKKQLAEANKKLSKIGAGSGVLSRHQSGRSMSRLLSSEGEYDGHDTDEDFEGNGGGLERAVIVKHHRDLAHARAEIADLAHQLVESAHREDEMQQCIIDLQQEISFIMTDMSDLQTQLQCQSHLNSFRQERQHQLHHEADRSSSLSSSSSLLPNYEIIEKYKQLYSESLERVQVLEEEILNVENSKNVENNSRMNSLHQEISQLQEENLNLTKEIFDLKQIHKETVMNFKKRNKEETSSSTELFEKQQKLHLLSTQRCQLLEEEILKEKEEKREMISQLSEELRVMREEKREFQQECVKFEQLYLESVKEMESWKEKEGERSREVAETQQQLKTIRSAFQDIAKPLNRLLSQDNRE